MNASAAMRETLRNIVCASVAYALVLQLVLAAMVSGAHASAPLTGVGTRGVICTSSGAVSAPLESDALDHHRSGGDCCSLGCASPAPSAPPTLRVLAGVLPIERRLVGAFPRFDGGAIRGPPARSAPQAPRAPPLNS
jgi:hypothetical protein